MRKRSRKQTVPALPPTKSAATVLGAWSPMALPLQRPHKRKGPAPGTVDRYGKDDRALYPELKRVMDDHRMSVTAAAYKLVEDGKVVGDGTPEGRARRLAKRYRADSALLADQR